MEEIDMNLRERIHRWRRYRTLIREMGDYSHHELTELGIARADIGRIAWNAAFDEPSRLRLVTR
jgi:uncharacterized protein YjiS (DUF1127 family)